MLKAGSFLVGAKALKKGSPRREKADTILNRFVSVKKKKKSICRFPDPSRENGTQGRMSRNACSHIFCHQTLPELLDNI